MAPPVTSHCTPNVRHEVYSDTALCTVTVSAVFDQMFMAARGNLAPRVGITHVEFFYYTFFIHVCPSHKQPPGPISTPIYHTAVLDQRYGLLIKVGLTAGRVMIARLHD